MPTASTLLSFSTAVPGLLPSAGSSTAVVVSQRLSGGLRGGIVSAAVVFAADLVLRALACASLLIALTMRLFVLEQPIRV